MKHDKLINRFLDGEATKEECRLVEKLINTDIDFKEELEQQQNLKAIFDNTEKVVSPDFLAERVLNSVKYSSPHKKSIFSRIITPALAASFSFIIGIYSANLLFTNTNQESTDSIFDNSTVLTELNVDDYITSYYGR
jgi:hypothetical protein